MLVHDFISAVIQHIPEKNQKLVRYYGYYSRRKKRKIKSSITIPNLTEKRVFCPNCHQKMEFVVYSRKPPPKDMSKLNSWIDLLNGVAR